MNGTSVDTSKGYRVLEKAHIEPGSELFERLAKIKGDSHQDGVLLDLWPFIFMSESGEEYIHFMLDRRLLFATRYVGDSRKEVSLLRGLLEHCRQKGLELCYLDMSNKRKPQIEQECGLLSTPMGVVQTIDDIREFTIAGAKMRRLRYLVERFKREGDCKLVEYTEPNPTTNREIRDIMLAWSREKGVVNKVDAILADMRVGNLLKRYRVYLTYINGKAQNVIILSHIGEGYITDQEYYLPDMPLGGTEYAYVEIIKLLAQEGCRKFSLGLTWGLFEPKDGFSDREGWELISQTEGQLGQIFQRGIKNHQYKDKYCPAEYPLYLYRAQSSRRQIIKQCMGQFFRQGVPFEEIQRQIEADQRAEDLGGVAPQAPDVPGQAEAPVEPVRVDAPVEPVRADAPVEPVRVDAPVEAARAAPYADIPDEPFDATRVERGGIKLDLMSDSWSHLTYDFVRERARQLASGISAHADDTAVVGRAFGVKHLVLTTSGRNAERVFFQTFRPKKKRILQNVPFFSTLHNEVKAGFESVEIPDPEIFNVASEKLFRGGVDLAQLDRHLDAQSADVAMVLIELCDNASGGYPVSLAQVKATAESCRRHKVPLVMDVTRIVKNAELIRRHEAGHERQGLWEIVAALVSHADFIVGSLCKEFGVSAGGILASNEEKPIEMARRYAEIEGAALDEVQSMVVCRAFQDLRYVEEKVAAQLDIMRKVHQELAQKGVPVMQPGAGHCILVRANEVPGFEARTHPRESLVRMLFERHGIRAGTHFVAGQADSVLGRCVRLALPLGLSDDRLVGYLARVLAPAGDGSSEPTLDFMRQGRDTPAEGSTPGVRPVIPGVSHERTASHAPPALDADIAIIGLSGRYPQAENVSEFWENLKAGRYSITEVSPERWDWREHFHPHPEEALKLRKSYGKWGGFLEGFAEFDPLFFWMAPRRVEFIDPQERLFLEECWKALEDAGYPPNALSPQVREKTGVFGGISKQGFNLYSAEVKGAFPYTSLATMVGRVSHFFDLKGPSMPVENHCASALVAVHEACEYLRQGKGVLAIAGGVNLSLHPSSYVHLSLVGMLSHNARSAAFGKGGVGYVPGEGVGVVILKRLAQAIEDGDHVYAVIRGSAVNSNGRMRYYGEPNQTQQEAVIRAALEQGRIDPRTVSYVEAAASGVETSDAVELAALSGVFVERAGTEGHYAVGSVKPNIGHCEAVSGMSQLTKVIMSLTHATLTPTLMPDELNPRVDFARLPFSLQRERTAWERVRVDGSEVPRRAGVTALGNGINAHLVVEEYVPPAAPPVPDHASSASPQLFVLSAQNKDRLREYVGRWIAWLGTGEQHDLAKLAYSLQVGREPMVARVAVLASTQEELLQRLRRWLDAGDAEGQSWSGDRRTARTEPEPRILDAVGSGRLEEVARLWVRGNSIPWARLAAGRAARRMGGLPTYPFARERYWIKSSGPPAR